jgi:hypothetical protein
MYVCHVPYIVRLPKNVLRVSYSVRLAMNVCRVPYIVRLDMYMFFYINIYCSMPRYRVILYALRHLILNLQESFTAMSYLVVKISCIII